LVCSLSDVEVNKK